MLDRGGYLVVHVEVAAEEAGFEFRIDAQEVMHDQYLAIAVFSRADADGGDVQAFGNLSCQHGGDLFQHQSEAACFFQDTGVIFQLFRLGFFLGPDGVGAEFIGGLWRKTKVSH